MFSKSEFNNLKTSQNHELNKEILIRTNYLDFNLLYNYTSLDNIINGMLAKLNRVSKPLGDNILSWDNDAHMKMKQLTRTKYLFDFAFMPTMLNNILSELYIIHSFNSKMVTLIRDIASVFRRGCPHVKDWIAVFKEFSINIKKNADHIENWYFYTDIELFTCYSLTYKLTAEEKTQKVLDWAHGYVDRGENEDEYYVIYEAVLRARMAKASHVPFNTSMSDFILSIGNWMTDGSSRGVRIEIEDGEGNVIKSNAKKQAIAMSMDLNTLIEKVYQKQESETYSTAEKIEPGRKGRLIVSAPFEQQIRLSYCEQALLEPIRKVFPDIFFLLPPAAQYARLQALTELSKKQKVFFPMDASSFDQFVSRREIEIVFDVLIDFANDPSVNPEVVYFLKLSKEAWFNTPVEVDKVRVSNWDHGVPSGVKWTALMDSIVNNVRWLACEQMLRKSEWGAPEVENVQFQGDDMLIVLRRLVDTVLILDWYKKHNIPIAPNKNFIMFSGFEFLRKVYQRGETKAYVNRLLPKFIFRLPENKGAENLESMLRERIDSVCKIANRSNNPEYLSKKALLFVRHVLEMDTNLAKKVLMSPVILGGFALLDPTQSVCSSKMLRLVWPKSEKKVGVVLQNLYKQSVINSAKYVGFITGSKYLSKSVYNALVPSERFDTRKPVLKMILTEFACNLNIKMRIQERAIRTIPVFVFARWVMISNSEDVKTKLRSMNDISTLISLVEDNLKAFIPWFHRKVRPSLFWKWVTTGLERPSFVDSRLSPQTRSVISDAVYSTLMYRRMSTKEKIDEEDEYQINVLSYIYISKNVGYWVENKYVYISMD